MEQQIKELPGETPNFYIFVANNVAWAPFTTGRQVIESLAKRHIWLASRSIPYHSDFNKGDGILFFVGGGPTGRFFIGNATIAGTIRTSWPEEKKNGERLGLEYLDDTIPLHSIEIWAQPLPIKPLAESLSFINDKTNGGRDLKRAVTKISAEDYHFLLQEAKQAEIPA